MGLRTPLFDTHVAAGARMVDFGGWDMPLHYGSQLEEHHAVRRDAGMFDVSHMCVVDLQGADTRPFLRRLLANDVAKLTAAGKALYSCMLNESGGVIDDLIVYYLSPTDYRMVVNAGTRDKDIAWLRRQAAAVSQGPDSALTHPPGIPWDVSITPRTDLAMIAVQGPSAREKASKLLAGEQASAALALKPFSAGQFGDFFVARTGYTGEDGFEIVVPAARAAEIWRRLAASGVAPCGLGARDTLRLEAGMNLYGNDMDENVSPLVSGLSWTVAFEPADRDFIGRSALQKQTDAGLRQKLVGLLLEDRGVLRSHQPVVLPDGSRGEITSGTFSPTLQRSIALARVPAAASGQLKVEIRNQLLSAQVVKYPFVRNGKSCLPQ